MQGMWGIFEVFFDTFVVCTMTAVVVLSSGYINLDTGMAMEGVSDATLVSQAFGNAFGPVGEMFIAIAMLLLRPTLEKDDTAADLPVAQATQEALTS